MSGPFDPSRYRCKMYSYDISVLTVTYGSTELVDYMTSSLFKQLGYPIPVVVVNNREPHKPVHNEGFFTEIDNSGNRLTDPDGSLGALLTGEASNNHAAAVSYGLSNCVRTRWCLLCDDDVLFKPTIRYLLESPCSDNCIGEIGCDKIRGNRVFPYMCIVDVGRMKDDGIRYFDPDRGASKDPPRDTGSSFLHDIQEKGWRTRGIDLEHFVVHMKGATLGAGNWLEWVGSNEDLWNRWRR